MKPLAFLILASAWICFFFAPAGGVSRLIQLLVFGLLGTVLALAGGFQYWWNSSMLPSQKSAFILICGLGTLASQLGSFLQGVLGDEGGTDWPQPKSKRPWRN
jgi:hypothetical protein